MICNLQRGCIPGRPTHPEPTKFSEGNPLFYSGADKNSGSPHYEVLVVHGTARYLYLQQTTNRIQCPTVFLAEDQSLCVRFSFTYQMDFFTSFGLVGLAYFRVPLPLRLSVKPMDKSTRHNPNNDNYDAFFTRSCSLPPSR